MFDIMEMSGAGCIGRITHLESMLIVTLIPIAMLTACIVAAWTYRHRPAFRKRGAQLFLVIMLLFYPSISLAVLQALRCRTISGRQFLVVDMSVECWTGEHIGYVVYASIVIAVVLVGWPLAQQVLLRTNKHKIGTDPVFDERFGLLYATYKPDMYLWGTSELLRKLFLTGIVVFFGRGTSLQVLLALLVSVLAHVAHLANAPFRDHANNQLQSVCLAATWLTMLASLALRLETNDSSKDVIAVFVVALNLVVVALAFPIALFASRVSKNKIERKTKKFMTTSRSEHDSASNSLQSQNLPRKSVSRRGHRPAKSVIKWAHEENREIVVEMQKMGRKKSA